MAKLKIRKEVIWFAGQMERKLRENDHKTHWSACGEDYLHERLNEEVTELHEAQRYNFPSRQVIREAADVANFAMMIADNKRKLKG